MKQIILIFVCLILSSCATQYDKRLLGSWKSDREGTVSYFYSRFPDRFNGSPETKNKFENLFGHMTHTFTLKDLTVENEDSKYTVEYKVRKIENDCVYLKLSGGTEDKIRIRFCENMNSYWVNEDSDFAEKFTKINTEQTGAGEPSAELQAP